jgi:hypothetical protein
MDTTREIEADTGRDAFRRVPTAGVSKDGP